MSSPYAFIFDMDGVIVDSNPYHKVALKQFCKKHGHELTEQQLREKIYGRTNKDWITNLFGKLPDEQVRQFAEEKEALFRTLYDGEIKPLEGLLSFLPKLDSMSISRAIATSAPRANADFTLAKTGTGEYFNVILDDSYVTQGKPDPEIYHKAANALGKKPGDCLVFEDSLSGIRAGKAAGCKVVGLTTTHTPQELFEADFIINNFVDLEPQTLISRVFNA